MMLSFCGVCFFLHFFFIENSINTKFKMMERDYSLDFMILIIWHYWERPFSKHIFISKHSVVYGVIRSFLTRGKSTMKATWHACANSIRAVKITRIQSKTICSNGFCNFDVWLYVCCVVSCNFSFYLHPFCSHFHITSNVWHFVFELICTYSFQVRFHK